MSQPTPTLDLPPGITGQILYLVGEDDALIDATQRNQIRAAFEQASIDHELVSYPAAGHAYLWPDTPAFNPDARDDSWAPL